MIRSELADELGVPPASVSKWLQYYSGLTGRPIETRLDSQTVADMQRARELTQEQPGMPFREALKRVLGQYTEPVPPASVIELMGRLDTLDQALARVEQCQGELQANQEAMTVKLELIAKYLRSHFTRRSGTDGPAESVLAGNEPIRPPEQAPDR
ncbi:hypothetical protein GCM10010840_34000 [Deinococcus aerolatus]|uniref:Helix-turn-helix domain-containing protein n=1 Tax=Deinococcus aerolatus TaxID=522487 RepID=A0ABQ2GFF8_9DEIO|nr:hypothetical protein [Deinococcus aerolatus]GGL93166.1 hypothetical protein GCM10010840_34000 [Deinococcus aerolatus]